MPKTDLANGVELGNLFYFNRLMFFSLAIWMHYLATKSSELALQYVSPSTHPHWKNFRKIRVNTHSFKFFL